MVAAQGRAPLSALVLSGGGARGAYEAGVMRYLRDELPPRLKSRIRFEIICGTSIGAVNCCFLAATNHVPEIQGRLLADVWQNLRIDDIYQLGFREIINLPKFLLGSKGRGQLDDPVGPGRLGGLFNTAPMEKLVRESLNWENISKNIASGDLKALALNATHMNSGKTHVFVQQANLEIPAWSTDPQVEVFPVKIAPEHALASSAIPWIFPAVQIQNHIYYDGGLKLNTPISPALRLGADRLLVVGLRSQTPGQTTAASMDRIESYPSAAFVLGKILNALLADKTAYDLIRVKRFNEIVEASLQGGAAEQIGQIMASSRGASYRHVDALVIQPSQDVSEIAGKHLRAGGIATRAGGIVGPILRRLAENSQGQGNELLSFLLFDGEYGRDLIHLGMHDADAMRQQLIDFFSV